MGKLYYDNYDYDAAIEAFAKTIELRDEEEANDYYARGVCYYKNDNYRAAIKDFTKAIKLRDEEDAQYYSFRGRSYYGDCNYKAALKDFTKVIEFRDEEDADDYFVRGVSYVLIGNYKAAIKDFTKAIKLRDEEDVGDYFIRGVSYYQNEVRFEKRMELEYDNLDGNTNNFYFGYQYVDYKPAIKDFTKAIKLRDKENAKDYYWRGRAYYRNDNYVASMKDINKALEIDPSYKEAKKFKKFLESEIIDVAK
jgi:tetratricopeptide (TPR) repeat protein